MFCGSRQIVFADPEEGKEGGTTSVQMLNDEKKDKDGTPVLVQGVLGSLQNWFLRDMNGSVKNTFLNE